MSAVRIERCQGRVNLLERENMKKLDEIDRLLDEVDSAKNELARLHRTYNFHIIDRSAETLSSYAAWANKLMP